MKFKNLAELNAKLGNDASESRDDFRFSSREKTKSYWTDITVVRIVTHHINNRDEVGGRFTVY